MVSGDVFDLCWTSLVCGLFYAFCRLWVQWMPEDFHFFGRGYGSSLGM